MDYDCYPGWNSEAKSWRKDSPCERIWDEIAESTAAKDKEISSEIRTILSYRIQQLENGKTKFHSFEEVEDRILKKYSGQ